MSSSASHWRMSCPNGASSASSSRPLWSSPKPSSLPEHSMPWLATPRSLPSLMRHGTPPGSAGGKSAPTVASGTRKPARALGAPHTIWRGSPCPVLTMHTRRRSALGWGSALSICATTTPANGGAAGVSDSTSNPAMVSTSASACVLRLGSQYWRSQDSGNCMAGAAVIETAPKSASRRQRIAASRPRRSAAWPGGQCRCQRQSQCVARGLSPCCE